MALVSPLVGARPPQPLSGLDARNACLAAEEPAAPVRTRAGPGATVELDAAQANYLGNVLRLGAGGELLIFDGFSGEWLARITDGQEAHDAERRAQDA